MGDRARLPVRTHEAAPNSSIERKGIEELRQLGRDHRGPDPVMLVESAFRSVFDASPRLSRRKWAQILHRAVRRADRYLELGSYNRGAGISWVLDRMLEDRDQGQQPHSAAFYVQRLDFESRQWRRAYKQRRAPLAA